MKVKNLKKLLLTIILICCISIPSINASAVFYTQTVTSSSGNILDIVLRNEGETAYSKGYYIFYNSSFAAASNKTFPYTNSNGYVYSIYDNGTTFSISGSAGCMAYSNYVCKYVFGTNAISANRINFSSTAGSMTANDVQSVITQHAQLGEHIRIDSTHSISFIAYDDNGFYYTDYADDSNPRIYIHYTTWNQFKNECNSKNKIAWIYNTNTSTNTANNSITIQSRSDKNEISNNNAIVHCNLNKPSGYAVTKIGIRVRKDGSNYNSGWSHYQTPTYGNYSTNTSVPISWNFKSELGFTPIHATKYYYQFYVVVNGKEYWSEEFYITTTGSHSYPSTWTTTKSATCTESGSAKRSCSCGKTETKTLSALGHNYSSSWTTDIAASCTTTGTKSHHCTRCSAKSTVTTIEATGHNWSSWKTTTEATCTSYGKQERTCSICSTKDFQNINPKGHTYSGTYTIDSAATCIAAGTKSKHCQNCSSKSSVTTINPTGHNWSEFTAISTATTEKQGISQRKCLNSGCSATESKSIPKLAIDGHTHAFAEWYNLKTATCTEQGEQQRHCTICSAAEKQTQAALGHNFGEWNKPDENGVIKRICSSCGNTEEQTSVIIPEEPTNNTQPTDTPIFEQTTTSENTEATQESNNLPYVVVGIILLLGGAGTAGFVVFKKKKSFNKPLED